MLFGRNVHALNRLCSIVEIEKYIDRPVVTQIVVERVIEKEVPVRVEIIKEVIVEKEVPVYIEKVLTKEEIVYVDRIVEKPLVVEKEVIVEKVLHTLMLIHGHGKCTKCSSRYRILV